MILAVLKSAARCIEARPFDENAGRRAGLALEVAHEIARAHMHAFRERLDGKIGIEVVEDPALQFGDRTVAVKLRREVGAELRLAPGPLKENYQQLGSRKCDISSEIVLHQGKGEIHAGGHAGRGVEPAVSQKNWIGLDPDRGVAPRQFIAKSPMRHGAATIQQARFRQQENAGADSAHPADSSRGFPEPIDTRLGYQIASLGRAGHDEGIERERGRRRNRARRVQANATGSVNGSDTLGPDFNLIGFGAGRCGKNMIGSSKDFERSDSVEQRDTRMSENSHVPRFELACGGMPDGLRFHGGATMLDPKVAGQSRQAFERIAVMNE